MGFAGFNNTQFLYSLNTEGPVDVDGRKKKKKKKKKAKKKPAKEVVPKEVQEEERLRIQKELEAQAEPDIGDAVDDRRNYLKDRGPKQLIINYLPVELSEEELKAVFEQYGPVECARFVCDKNTGKSKGYGFVYYYYSAHAAAAIAGMNGFELYGKLLRVSYAVPQRPNPATTIIDPSTDSSSSSEDEGVE